MGKAIRNLLPRCYHRTGLLGPFSAGEHTGRGRMQTIFQDGTCLIPSCHTSDWIYLLCTLPSSLGFRYLHNPHSTLGSVRSCPQTEKRLQRSPAPKEVYSRPTPACGPSRTNPARSKGGAVCPCVVPQGSGVNYVQ